MDFLAKTKNPSPKKGEGKGSYGWRVERTHR